MRIKQFYFVVTTILLGSTVTIMNAQQVQARDASTETVETTNQTVNTPTVDPIDQQSKVQSALNLVENTPVLSSLLSENYTDSDFMKGMSIGIGGINSTTVQKIISYLSEKDSTGNYIRLTTANEIIPAILDLKAIGQNPTNFVGRNLIAELYQSTGEDAYNKWGSITVASALLALDSDNYQIPTNATFSKNDLVQYLIVDASHYDNEAWGYYDQEYISNVDTTAIVLTALAAHKGATTNLLISNAMTYLINQQNLDGGYGFDMINSNVNSTAEVILAATSLDIDPTTIQKGPVNVLSALINFQQADGTFKTDYSQPMAIGQALVALKAYELFKKGRGRVYDFAENPIRISEAPTLPVHQTKPETPTVPVENQPTNENKATVQPIVEKQVTQTAATQTKSKVALPQTSEQQEPIFRWMGVTSLVLALVSIWYKFKGIN